MRTAVLIAVSLLIGGCSHATVDEAQPGGTAQSESATSTGATTPTSATSPSVRSAPPATGAPIADVIGWIEAGHPVAPDDFHTATRGTETTDLGDDVAFTVGDTGSAATVCVTDSRYTGGALACLVDLADPPPRPENVYGEWKGNWVDFDGSTVQVGSAHGDPGPFRTGNGRQLPDGATLAFADYRCRAEQADLFCVNYAHRSAVRMGPSGVVPFGCLNPAPAPEDAGRFFTC